MVRNLFQNLSKKYKKPEQTKWVRNFAKIQNNILRNILGNIWKEPINFRKYNEQKVLETQINKKLRNL